MSHFKHVLFKRGVKCLVIKVSYLDIYVKTYETNTNLNRCDYFLTKISDSIAHLRNGT